MRSFDKQSGNSVTQPQPCLETPSTVGYRAGMSETGVIGRKLGSIYKVDTDLPRAFDTAIQAVRREFGSRG